MLMNLVREKRARTIIISFFQAVYLCSFGSFITTVDVDPFENHPFSNITKLLLHFIHSLDCVRCVHSSLRFITSLLLRAHLR